MATPTQLPPGMTWKELNRVKKEERRKRQEEKLVKKIRKEEENAEAAKSKLAEQLNSPTDIENINVSTLSIAIPGSILDNAQSPELRTYLAGQIARAACVYKVDEIIVFDDRGDVTEPEKKKLKRDDQLGEARIGCLQLGRILQYLECPQYLRKYFFPLHKDLQYAGVLNPLDTPHHLRQQDISLFREGIVSKKPIKAGKGSQVNVGLLQDVEVDKTLTPGLRVTVRIPTGQNSKKLKGTIVSPTVPRKETGIYWGYVVRLASNVSKIFSECPYDSGYDLTIGTSDKGSSIDDVKKNSLRYHHGLVVFGGVSGLEAAVEADPLLDVEDTAVVFHEYLNTCPEQGSRTIRTEEAVLVTLAELRSKLAADYPPKPNPQFPNSSGTAGDGALNESKNSKETNQLTDSE